MVIEVKVTEFHTKYFQEQEGFWKEISFAITDSIVRKRDTFSSFCGCVLSKLVICVTCYAFTEHLHCWNTTPLLPRRQKQCNNPMVPFISNICQKAHFTHFNSTILCRRFQQFNEYQNNGIGQSSIIEGIHP